MDEVGATVLDNSFWDSVLNSNRKEAMNGETCFFHDADLDCTGFLFFFFFFFNSRELVLTFV